MSQKQIINSSQVPQAIGTYSQAVKVGTTLYLSGQIPLDPHTMELAATDIERQVEQVFINLQAVLAAAGGNFSHIVKLNIYLTDLGHFQLVNQSMARHFKEPYPARAAIGVAQLPKGALVEMDAIAEMSE
jgi:reactive intermediate/imine deaminase